MSLLQVLGQIPRGNLKPRVRLEWAQPVAQEAAPAVTSPPRAAQPASVAQQAQPVLSAPGHAVPSTSPPQPSSSSAAGTSTSGLTLLVNASDPLVPKNRKLIGLPDASLEKARHSHYYDLGILSKGPPKLE